MGATAGAAQRRGARRPSALAFGTPAEVRKVLLEYEAADCDQMILIAQFGKMKHEDICDSLELFGKEVLPEFMEREEKRAKQKGSAARTGDRGGDETPRRAANPLVPRGLRNQVRRRDGYAISA